MFRVLADSTNDKPHTTEILPFTGRSPLAAARPVLPVPRQCPPRSIGLAFSPLAAGRAGVTRFDMFVAQRKKQAGPGTPVLRADAAPVHRPANGSFARANDSATWPSS
jgi:hypothetical protein